MKLEFASFFDNFVRNIKKSKSFTLTGLTTFSRLLLLKYIQKISNKKILFITSTEQSALKYASDLGRLFEIDSKTGEIVCWARYLRNSTRELTPEEMNESDERLAIAKKFVEENTTGEYELTWDNGEANVKTKSEGILHTFFFNKRISGLLTADKICVTVNSLGEICSYKKNMIM